MVAYHDTEWGVPLRDEDRLFELLCLEGAQAGLSWTTILNRRDGYRAADEGFDAARIVADDDDRQAELLLDPRIIRNRAKVRAFRGNAAAVLALRPEGPGRSGSPVGVRGWDADREPVARGGVTSRRPHRCQWRCPRRSPRVGSASWDRPLSTCISSRRAW